MAPARFSLRMVSRMAPGAIRGASRKPLPRTSPRLFGLDLAVARRGAWPLQLPDHYPADGAHLAEYAKLAGTAEGFARYCEQYVTVKRAA